MPTAGVPLGGEEWAEGALLVITAFLLAAGCWCWSSSGIAMGPGQGGEVFVGAAQEAPRASVTHRSESCPSGPTPTDSIGSTPPSAPAAPNSRAESGPTTAP